MSVYLGRSPLPPLEAWRDDSHRCGAALPRQVAADWLLVANAVWRAGQLPPSDAHTALADVAGLIGRLRTAQFTSVSGGSVPSLGSGEHYAILHRVQVAVAAAAEAARATVADAQLSAPVDCGVWQAFGDELQAGATILERAGAFALADSLLAATARLLPPFAGSVLGRIWAQRGRIARQAGDHIAAQHLYAATDAQGRKHGDVDLRIRAALGLGALAVVRGNYPHARTLFRRAIRWATATGQHEYLAGAHQGLFAAALAADDVNTALRHGWAAFRTSGSTADRRAELVGMLAQVALRVGDAHAALHAYRVSLSLTADTRLRLIALGGIATAAGSLEMRTVVDEAQQNAAGLIAHSPHTFENAYVMYELAAANAQLQRREQAVRCATAAEQHARQHHHYEVLHRAEALIAVLGHDTSSSERRVAYVRRGRVRTADDSASSVSSPAAAPHPSSASKSVPSAAVGEGLDLSPHARHVLRSLHTLRTETACEAEAVRAC